MNIVFLFANNKLGFKKFGGEIIKEVEGTPFCHFAILYDDKKEQTVYEAVFPRSRKIPYSEWLKEYEVHTIFHFKAPSEESMSIYKTFLDSLINKIYAFDQCVWIAFCIWFKIRKTIQEKVKLNGSKSIICTELGYLFTKKFFNFDLINIYNTDRVDLRDMFSISLILKANNKELSHE